MANAARIQRAAQFLLKALSPKAFSNPLQMHSLLQLLMRRLPHSMH